MSSPYAKNVTWLFGLIMLISTMLGCPVGITAARAADTISLPVQTVAPGEAILTVKLELPAGCKFNQETPSTFGLKSSAVNIVAIEEKYAQNLPAANLPLSLTVPVKEGKTTLQANYRINYCDEKLGICFFREAVLSLPVEVTKSCPNKKLEIVYKVPSN